MYMWLLSMIHLLYFVNEPCKEVKSSGLAPPAGHICHDRRGAWTRRLDSNTGWKPVAHEALNAAEERLKCERSVSWFAPLCVLSLTCRLQSRSDLLILKAPGFVLVEHQKDVLRRDWVQENECMKHCRWTDHNSSSTPHKPAVQFWLKIGEKLEIQLWQPIKNDCLSEYNLLLDILITYS